MKKVHLKLLLLSLVLACLLAACNRPQQNERNIEDSGNSNSTPIATSVQEFEIRYRAEQFPLFPYNPYKSYDIGSVILHDNVFLIPRIAEGLRWSDELLGEAGVQYQHLHNEVGDVSRYSELICPNGERLIVGQDIQYGEDFFSFPYFQLFAIDYENDHKELITSYIFEHDVTHVHILAVNIVSLHEGSGIILIANQLKENGEISTIFAQLTKGYFNTFETTGVEIGHHLLGGENVVILDVLFDADNNILICTYDFVSQRHEIIILDATATRELGRISTYAGTKLVNGYSGDLWGIERVMSPSGAATVLRSLNRRTWSWESGVELPLEHVHVFGLYTAPQDSEFVLFVNTNNGLYGITEENKLVQYFAWLDIDVDISQSVELVFLESNNAIIVFNYELHPQENNAITLNSFMLFRTDSIDEREILTVGGVNVKNSVIFSLIRQFNRESSTHRAVIFDYAEHGEWDGVAMRLRADLIRGAGPDVIIFNQWGDENDITTALMRGGFLTDLNVLLENDSVLSREDFFENILDIWTNEAGELSLIAGAVIPTPYWGPSEKLENFTDFTHEGFLSFLRNSQAQGIAYPMGLNFLPYVVLQTMIFADNTFFCLETGEANFDSDLFLDILAFADSIGDEQQNRWMEALHTGEAHNPIAFISRGEQLLTNFLGFMEVNDFRIFDASVGGMTPIGAPNAAGDLSIATRPIWRMGIRANSQHTEAAWEFIRLNLLYPNASGATEGIPVKRSIFENDINKAFLEGGFSAGGFFGFADGAEIPAFTEERADLLRYIMESITHEYHPNPHVMAIVWEEAFALFAGERSIEDTARIIQSRVAIYLSEVILASTS